MDRKDKVPQTESKKADNNDFQFNISLDPVSGSTKFQRKELASSDTLLSADELISLAPNRPRSASVSVNTSLVTRGDNELKRTATISNPGNVGRLHPAIPKIGMKSPSKRSRNSPSKKEIAELRKKNPRVVRNAVYCLSLIHI